jgi:hypothetical protein
MALSQETFNQAFGNSAWQAPAVGGFSFLKSLKETQKQVAEEERQAQEAEWRRRQFEETRADRQQGLSEQRLTREAIEKQKRDDKASQLNVPGYELTGEVSPLPGEAEKIRASTAAQASLLESAKRYKELMKETGGFENPLTARGQELKSLATSMAMDLKNIYGLGVLAGPDMAILASQIPDPTSLRSLLTPNKAQAAGLEELTSGAKSRMTKGLAAKGYREAAPVAKPSLADTILSDPEAGPDDIAWAKAQKAAQTGAR